MISVTVALDIATHHMHRSPSPAASVRMLPALVVCGPSGVGKGCLLKKITEKFPVFAKSVSHTSRAPRPGEVHGVDYYFVSKDEILGGVELNMFLEHAVVHGNAYGTSVRAVEDVQKLGKICLLEIDVQGAKQVKRVEIEPRPKFLFVAPPSMEELEKRLRGRNTESEEKIALRLKNAAGEMQVAEEKGFFDAVIVNGQLEKAVEDFENTLKEWYPDVFEKKTSLL